MYVDLGYSKTIAQTHKDDNKKTKAVFETGSGGKNHRDFWRLQWQQKRRLRKEEQQPNE